MEKRIFKIFSLLIASSLLIGGSIVLGGYYISWHTQQVAIEKALTNTASAVASAKPVVVAPDAVQGIPVKIEVPSVGVSEPVDKGYYDPSTGHWTLSYHAVYWATMTSPINSQTGNTYIYGHDVPQIFGNLLKAETGAKAIVTTDNGYQFTYTLVSSKAYGPNDTSAIQPTAAPTLTVQTCSGSWYQYRQMLTFKLDSFKKV